MLTLAVTGGVAMGKSTFCARLLSPEGPLAGRVAFFDCDESVRELLTEVDTLGRIRAAFGDSVITSDGQIDRPRLRERVFNSAEQRAELENIVHPAVRQRCAAARARARGGRSTGIFAADIPLLFETGFDWRQDLTVVVACSAQAQRSRLLRRDGITEAIADRMVAAQFPVAEKIRRADAVLWNDGNPCEFNEQSDLFCQWLKHKI